MDKKSATQQMKRLTVDQTDELIRQHAAPAAGAIEDAEVERNVVSYFFESGAVGRVDRSTGNVTFTEAN